MNDFKTILKNNFSEIIKNLPNKELLRAFYCFAVVNGK